MLRPPWQSGSVRRSDLPKSAIESCAAAVSGAPSNAAELLQWCRGSRLGQGAFPQLLEALGAARGGTVRCGAVWQRKVVFGWPSGVHAGPTGPTVTSRLYYLTLEQVWRADVARVARERPWDLTR